MNDYEIALSSTDEQRRFVSEVADRLAAVLGRDKVFYDKFCQAELAQPSLDLYLQEIYLDRSRLVVVFLGSDIGRKEWHGLERWVALDLIKSKRSEQIMLVRVEEGSAPGSLGIDGWVDARGRDAREVADLILERWRLLSPIPPLSAQTGNRRAFGGITMVSRPDGVPRSRNGELGVATRERWFGPDGIRARFGEPPLDRATVTALGRQLGSLLLEDRRASASSRDQDAPPLVVLGGDTRSSTPEICEWLAAGLTAGGAEVRYAGVIPAPAVSFLTLDLEAAVGVMVSASHYPYPDNGIKLFDDQGLRWGETAEGQFEERLRDVVGTDTSVSIDAGLGSPVPNDSSSRPLPFPPLAPDTVLRERYLRHLAATIGAFDPRRDLAPLGGLSVVLDTGNGAAFSYAGELFRSMGAEVTLLGAAPDGRNVNLGCGSSAPEGMAAAVVASGAHLGVALDGDGARCILADERGMVRDGDAILYLWATELQRAGQLVPPVIVATSMSNLGLDRALASGGVAVERCGVGERQVVKTMRRDGILLGGEQSGNIVNLDLEGTGDGLLTALQIAAFVHRAGRPLSELLSGFRRYPQTLINVRVASKPDISTLPRVVAAVRTVDEQLGAEGRLLLRYSDSEPLIRVMIEGPDQGAIEILASGLASVIHEELGQRAGVGLPTFVNPFDGAVDDEAIASWLKQFEQEERQVIAALLPHFRFYSFARVTKKLTTLHQAIARGLNLDAPSIWYIPVGYVAKSGSLIAYLYRTTNDIPQERFILATDLAKVVLRKDTAVVFLDDYIGSGHQARQVWDGVLSINPKAPSLCTFVFGALVGTESGIGHVESTTGFKIYVVDQLSEVDMPLGLSSRIFTTDVDRLRAGEILKRYGWKLDPKAPLGYANSQGLLAFFYSTPNNTLPIFWSTESGWRPLLPHKESYRDPALLFGPPSGLPSEVQAGSPRKPIVESVKLSEYDIAPEASIKIFTEFKRGDIYLVLAPIIKSLGLSDMSLGDLLRLMGELKHLVHEREGISSSLLVVPQDMSPDSVGKTVFSAGAGTSLSGTSDLIPLVQFIRGYDGALVVKPDGAVLGTVLFRDTGPTSYTLIPERYHKAARASLDSRGLLFLFNGDGRAAAFYQGNRILVYRGSSWHLQPSDIDAGLGAIATGYRVTAIVLQKIFRLAIRLSDEGSGALITVGDHDHVLTYAEIPKIAHLKWTEMNVVTSESEALMGLMRQDGATIINAAGSVVQGMTFLRPPADARGIVEAGRGSKHSTAAKISGITNSLAVAISVDGIVTVFGKGEIVLKLMG